MRLLIVACLGCTLLPRVALSADAAPHYAVQGRTKFTQQKYDEAIDLLRKHLIQTPRDYAIWNLLAAAYYYTGQPRKALRYLKHVERLTTEKSYNYFYQGLCYEAISPATFDVSTGEELAKAREYFTFAAQRYSDEYAARAAYEVGVLEYNAKNKPRAQYWLSFYLQHYPHGVYGMPASRLLQSLRDGYWFEHVAGTKKPDMEDALFRYNPISLSPTPHYWFVQGGFQGLIDSAQEPKPAGKVGSTQNNDYAILANAGLGIGPWHQEDTTFFAGYTYRQIWHTDDDRLTEYAGAPSKLAYFPFRADQLERKHQFYGDFRRDVSGLFYFGAFGRYEFSRIGADQYFPSPEIKELQKSLKIADTQLLIPWIGTSYLEHYRTLFYVYMRKEINFETPGFSNKSYDFGLSGGTPVASFGISHAMDFPQLNLGIDLELFQYEFIYNDNWLDYKRQGAFLSTEVEFLPRWYFNGIAGYYRDQYALPRLKSASCSGNQGESGSSAAANAPPLQCPRVDSGLLFEAILYWNYSQFQRYQIMFQYVDNSNPTQKEFQENKMTVQFMYTMAFPSVKRVARFIDRFADTAFTKVAQ
ncbi:MAG: hypothetical protein NTZ90_11020 [Proteobacteria bacterium]|nr:hypothetical protein [Pseudomonadota bacterium]